MTDINNKIFDELNQLKDKLDKLITNQEATFNAVVKIEELIDPQLNEIYNVCNGNK